MTISSKKVVSPAKSTSITTLPTDICWRAGYDWAKLTYVIRECHSNAKNYGAKKALILCVWMNGYDYLLYMHDGQPFEDLGDIQTNGLVANQTAQRGAAMQGCGLITSAGAMHRNPEIYIASFCANKKFQAGRGYRNDLNHWIHDEDVTDAIGRKLNALVGEEASKYSVFYFFRCSLTSKPKRNYLSSEMMSQLTMMAPSFLDDMTVYFAEKQIGHPQEKDKKYKSYATAVKSGTHRKVTNMHRRVCSAQGFVDRFRLENGHFELKCAPFDVEVKPNLIYTIDAAHLEIDIFPCRYEKPGDTWPMNERSGEDAGGGKFKQGGKNELGKQPTRKAFLTCPWVYQEMLKEVGAKDAERFSRFVDNALGTYAQIGRMMNLMGCRYVKGAVTPTPGGGVMKPYATIRVVIDSVASVRDESQNPPLEETARPLPFLGDMNRRPDFTFENDTALHKIMSTACERVIDVAENEKELKRLREVCSELFPVGDDEFITLNLEKGPTKMPKKQSPLIPIQYDGQGNVVVSDGTVHVTPGSTTFWSFRIRGTDKYTGDVQLCPLIARGSKATVIPQEYAEQIPGIEEGQKKILEMENNNDE